MNRFPQCKYAWNNVLTEKKMLTTRKRKENWRYQWDLFHKKQMQYVKVVSCKSEKPYVQINHLHVANNQVNQIDCTCKKKYSSRKHENQLFQLFQSAQKYLHWSDVAL